MQASIEKQKKNAHKQWIDERDHIQTSIVSKQQQDAQEMFKLNQRKLELKESTQMNIDVNKNMAQSFYVTRNNNLFEEKNWLREIN